MLEALGFLFFVCFFTNNIKYHLIPQIQIHLIKLKCFIPNESHYWMHKTFIIDL